MSENPAGNRTRQARRRLGVRAWLGALGLLALLIYLGFILLAVIRLPGAVGH